VRTGYASDFGELEFARDRDVVESKFAIASRVKCEPCEVGVDGHIGATAVTPLTR
jgi:hypothetical protein